MVHIGDFGQPVDDTAAIRAKEAQERVDQIIGRESEMGAYGLEAVAELMRKVI